MLLVLAVLAAIFLLPSPWDFLVVIAAAIVEAAEVWFWIWYTNRRRPVVGAEALVGATAVAATPLRPVGQVRVAGELWRARTEGEATTGDRVVIDAVEPDLTLVVRPEQGKSHE